MIFAVMAFVLSVSSVSAVTNSFNSDDFTYVAKFKQSDANLEGCYTFYSKDAFDKFLNAKDLFELECTFEGSAGVGQNYVKVKVSGPCAEARAEFDRQMASLQEEAGSWWDDVVDWWDSL